MTNEELLHVNEVPYYSPENSEYTKNVLNTTIQTIRNYIIRIKKYNPKLGNELENELNSLTSLKNKNLYEQMNMNDKLDNLLSRIIEIYNSRILRSRIIEKIYTSTESFKENFTQIAPKQLRDIINSIESDIENLVELDDIMYVSEQFNRFRALCISIYYRKKDGDIQHDDVFKELIGDFKKRQGLDTYIQGLNIEDNKEYKRIMVNSDESFEYLYSPDIWRIMADYFDIPIQAPQAEVVIENENSTSLTIPNEQHNNWLYRLFHNLALSINRIFSRSLHTTLAIEDTRTSAVKDNRTLYEQLKDIYDKNGAEAFLLKLSEFDFRNIGFPKEKREAYLKRLDKLEKIPNELFTLNNDEDIWITCDIIADLLKKDENRFDFIDKDGNCYSIQLIGEPGPSYSNFFNCKQIIKFEMDEAVNVFCNAYFSPKSKQSPKELKRFVRMNYLYPRVLYMMGEIDFLFDTDCVYSYIKGNMIDRIKRDSENDELYLNETDSIRFLIAKGIAINDNILKISGYQIHKLKYQARRNGYNQESPNNGENPPKEADRRNPIR